MSEMNEKVKRIEELTKQLEELLTTDEKEFADMGDRNPKNWQADKARLVAGRLLGAAEADGCGGCPLCWS